MPGGQAPNWRYRLAKASRKASRKASCKVLRSARHKVPHQGPHEIFREIGDRAMEMLQTAARNAKLRWDCDPLCDEASRHDTKRNGKVCNETQGNDTIWRGKR